MITHTISFRYSGGMASQGAMDVGYVERASAGARIVLASHAYFLTTGTIPTYLFGSTSRFRVLAVAPRRGTSG